MTARDSWSIGYVPIVYMECTNPFRSDPYWDFAFVKWGQPNNLGRDANGEFRYRCGRCLASWVGPNGDVCEWCHDRWMTKQADFKDALLNPEWLSWGDRYLGAMELDREVWANTRGFRGNFIRPWLQRIEKAKANGEITESEFVAAGRRVSQWINKMR